MKKLLATDLDGTLLKKDNTISKETYNAIKALKKEGHYFVVDTGRPYFRTKKILEDIGLNGPDDYCICFNGGLILTGDGKKILYEQRLEDIDTTYLVDLAHKFNIGVLVYLEDHIEYDYLSPSVSYLSNLDCMKLNNGGISSLRELKNVFKIIYIGEVEDIKYVKNNLPQEAFERFSILQSDDKWIEIMPKIVDKGNAILKLANLLGIKYENTIAVGDQENDLPMIEKAYLGVAVSNAVDIIKEKSGYITKSNMEDGVRRVIEGFVLENKILISACLMGRNCKYNGGNNLNNKLLLDLKDYYLIPVCPEVDGGLTIPRRPSEGNKGAVINDLGEDVTDNFNLGAKIALDEALLTNTKYAILKERSPSCGVNAIYDGTFSSKIIKGSGVTTKLLKENGITVYSEENYPDLLKLIEKKKNL